MGRSTACRLCGRAFEQYGGAGRSHCKGCTAKADSGADGVLRAECRECGEPFPTRTRSVKYCSDACRVDGKRRVLREYMRRYMADPGHHARMLARVRATKSARRAREGGGRRQRRPPPQSQAGRRAAGGSRRGAGRAKPSVCGLCGSSFEPYRRTHHAYCRRCTAKADREVGRVRRIDCRECGKAFSAKANAVRYCSDACRTVAEKRAAREYRLRRAAGRPRPAAGPGPRGAPAAARSGGK